MFKCIYKWIQSWTCHWLDPCVEWGVGVGTATSIYMVLGLEPWASCMPGKDSTDGIVSPGSMSGFQTDTMLLHYKIHSLRCF